ncbi:MAG: bifunctional metallophosphatase/5'-nucleotidase [Lachnospiraceae bacterium]|nr:bifunctional metallophosphatase/5'-nucleotidase [Lachnospiraceae bacterium]
MKKLYGIVLSLSLSLTMLPMVPARAAEQQTTYKAAMKTHSEIFSGGTSSYKGKTVILHTNDVHGQIDGYAYIAELEDDFEDAGAEVITVDAGDYMQGDPWVNLSKGQTAIDLMEAAGYEYSTIGNHEFDFGWENLKSKLSDTKFKVLCADMKENGKTYFDGNIIYTTKTGVKIGFFGLDTPETQSKSNPAMIQGITFDSNKDGKRELYDCANAQIKELQSKGANIIISLAHLGMDEESKADGHRSVDVYHNTKGIDLMLDGHSHTVMTEAADGEPIQSTGTKFDNIGVAVIDDSTAKITDHYLVDTEGLKKDEEVEAKADKVINEIAKIYDKKLAYSEVRFASVKAENRFYETNTGDLITDALMWALKDKNYEMKVDDDHIIVLQNGGGIRAGLDIGDITKRDINKILPFGNTVCVAYVPGKVILEVLEAATFTIEESEGGFPQTKGIKFSIDTAKTYDKGQAYPGTNYFAPQSIQRVSIESIGGKPFSENETYAIVTNDFVAAGGDTFYAIKTAESSFDTGFSLEEIVCDYIEKELKGKLSAELYGQARGDIRVLPEKETVSYITKPSVPSIKSVKANKKKTVIKWKESTGSVTGYEVSYSTNKKFTKKVTKTIKIDAPSAKFTVKKLSLKKNTFVRIRSYVTTKDGKVYSKWSKIKKIKKK